MRKWIAGAGLLAAGLIATAPAASAATSQMFYGSSAGFGSAQAVRYATDAAWRKVDSSSYTRNQCYISSSQARPTNDGWWQADVAVLCVKP